MPQYCHTVFSNCPSKDYHKLEETYLYAIWTFFIKIITFSELFHHEHSKIFEIRIEKFPNEKHDSIIEDSSCAIKFCCTSDRVAALRILQQKARCIIVAQNIGCPQAYWKYNYLS